MTKDKYYSKEAIEERVSQRIKRPTVDGRAALDRLLRVKRELHQIKGGTK